MAGTKILVVDDDPGVVRIITSTLAGEGREFITAEDGVEAVEKVFTLSPDIVILDVRMPKMNGYQVCRLLKNDRSTWGIPVVMLTAKDRDRDRMYGLSVGAEEFIVKPFHSGELRETVDRLLAHTMAWPKQCPLLAHIPVSETSILTRVNSLLDRKLMEMTFLQEMTKAIVSTFDEDVILGLVLDGIGSYLGYERAAVFMMDDHGAMAEKKSRGIPAHPGKYSFDTVDTEVQHRLLHLMEPVVMNGSLDEDRFTGRVAAGPDDGRYAAIPIVSREETRGVLLVDRDNAGAPFSEERTGVLLTMAGQLGLALENARLYRAMLTMSITDGLTGLYNARYFYNRMDVEITRARRYGRPLTLFMLDIDFFKRFNDAYGHLTGDDALKSLAAVLMENTRGPDTVARYGGEEFAVILPETDIEKARVLAERIRAKVEEMTLPVGPDHAPGRVSVTVSIGMATLSGEDEGKAERLVRRADKALYRAKEEGRNRVCAYEQSPAR